ncbi:MAG: hypothetical protein HC888_05845 [Candidatus Competibacteraceae bacterium]|nr:hypothetical protein [Candidatus Competibacteraceae bacterium]
MSKLVVEVCEISGIKPHPNADKLDLALVKGWQAIIPKGAYKGGEKIVYFPPDTCLPLEQTDRFGVTNYTSRTSDQGQRIRQAKLRGEPSFGLVVNPDDVSWGVGRDVADHYGAKKYVPPLLAPSGDAIDDDPYFLRYTEIENMRNFPDVLIAGEKVIATEKIHGTQVRLGIVNGEWMVGSKQIRRARPDDNNMRNNFYWFPYTLEPVRKLLEAFKDAKVVILYGETFGRVQNLKYGLNNALAFRAFDLMVDGKYMDACDFLMQCDLYGVETVPLIGSEPFVYRCFWRQKTSGLVPEDECRPTQIG